MNGPLPFPSFNPPPAYPLHYPGSGPQFGQPAPAPSEAHPLGALPDLPPQLQAGPSTGRYMPYPLHGLPAPLSRVSASNDHSAHPSIY
ncbi:hypothetical protein BDR07DRAFT_1413096 [Suillus spraguei]|nr:hypothetical protein BDR07DRAFT_1413096 [Suillus spraguei]